MLDNNMPQKFFDELLCKGEALSTQNPAVMIGEMTNVKTEDNIEQHQLLESKCQLGVSYIPGSIQGH